MSRHSWAPRFFLLTVEGGTDRQVPVFFPQHSLHFYMVGVISKVFYRSACVFCTLRLRISLQPSLRSRAWSPIQNSVRPIRVATRFPVTSHESIQFSEAEIVISGSTIPTCFTGRWVTPLAWMLVVTPRKSSRRNELWGTSSTGWKTSLTPGLMFRKKYHSCWRSFCRSEKYICRCRRSTSVNISTESVQPLTFFVSHSDTAT